MSKTNPKSVIPTKSEAIAKREKKSSAHRSTINVCHTANFSDDEIIKTLVREFEISEEEDAKYL